MIPKQYRVWLKDKALLGLNKTHFDRPEIGRMFPVEILDFESESVEIRTPSRLDFSWGEVEIMECVGLKDKNDKMIYEGDIVKYWFCCINGDYTEAIFRYSLATVQFYMCEFNLIGNYNGKILGQTRQIEVIGNIYENKNLLTKE